MSEDTSETEGYKCPYCHRQYTCDDWGFDYDDEEMECDDCGKKFFATAEQSIDFISHPSCQLNNEIHDWVFGESSSVQDFLICKKCDKYIFKKHQAEKYELCKSIAREDS